MVIGRAPHTQSPRVGQHEVHGDVGQSLGTGAEALEEQPADGLVLGVCVRSEEVQKALLIVSRQLTHRS